METDNDEEGTSKITKPSRKKQKVKKGDVKGCRGSDSPLNLIKDQYGDDSPLEEPDPNVVRPD